MIPTGTSINANDYAQWRDATTFLRLLANDMGWIEAAGEIIMDIGCGTGHNSTRLLLDLYPNVGKIVAMDESEQMIRFAKTRNQDPKVEYITAEIEDESILARWRGCASKLFSVHCIHWVQDQHQAFRNIFELLKPGGEAALLFCLNGVNFEVFEDMKVHPRWKQLTEHLQSGIPISQTRNWDDSYYRRFLTEIGFDVVMCEKRLVNYTYVNDNDCKGYLGSTCPMMPDIPFVLRSEFTDSLFERLIEKCGRTLRGLPKLKLNHISILIRKPLEAKSSSEPPTVFLRESKL